MGYIEGHSVQKNVKQKTFHPGCYHQERAKAQKQTDLSWHSKKTKLKKPFPWRPQSRWNTRIHLLGYSDVTKQTNKTKTWGSSQPITSMPRECGNGGSLERPSSGLQASWFRSFGFDFGRCVQMSNIGTPFFPRTQNMFGKKHRGKKSLPWRGIQGKNTQKQVLQMKVAPFFLLKNIIKETGARIA